MPSTLGNCIEELATRLVLGDLNTDQMTSSLRDLCGQAETACRSDVSRMATELLDALATASSQSDIGAVCSRGIERMQRALTETAPELSVPVPASLGEDREIVGDFILESREHLAQIEIQMMILEKEPRDGEAINTVFRGFHTIKGLAGFMDLHDIREVAHETETLLDLARNQRLTITPVVVDIVLAAADFLKVWLTRLEAGLSGATPGAAPEKAVLLEQIRRGTQAEPKHEPTAVTEPDRETGPAETGQTDRQKKLVLADSGNPDPPSSNPGNSDPEARSAAVEHRSVKVDTAKLDFLVDMAGEMVIAQSMVRHHPELAALRTPSVLRSLAQLARITGDLHKTAMSMRMVPIGGLFQKMSRLVRDLARKTGKQAEMEAIGADTELDRNVVEELADPLMHMVRNAADHGIETTQERLAAGKDITGHIRLRASHQAGHIVIEVADDGRGLNREKILAKARRMGLVEDGENLSDSEVFNYIFHPGFSTAAQVTDVSGRGVGMDVVRKHIQKLRGRIDIQSTPGKGSSFFLRLPLTLAMIDGLVVGVGAERYVVPIFSVREMLRPSEDMVFTVENRQEMALVRNSLLPVVRLYQRFGVKPHSEIAAESLLIVAEAAGRSFCLMVDELIGKQEVVIKSLGESLRDIPGIAGGAILGDGRVGLILDLDGIFRAGGK
jgi:two-component system, chemotaxis family, sensor kinase CheA